LKHRLQGSGDRTKIQVVTKYGDLPPISCYPGQLNQVFMNIIANAIDAFDELEQNHSHQEIPACPNIITITTSVDLQQQTVIICIQDNGPGMLAEVQARIFEQSFTTKAVGKGTGLGLAISYQIIVDKHNGQLKCLSIPGEGTKFNITLPMLSNNY
jgi:signal transduction histidine kinase